MQKLLADKVNALKVLLFMTPGHPTHSKLLIIITVGSNVKMTDGIRKKES